MNKKINNYSTEILAISREDGQLQSFSGPLVQATSEKEAQKWCDENMGYCKVIGKHIVSGKIFTSKDGSEIEYDEEAEIPVTPNIEVYVFDGGFDEDSIYEPIQWLNERDEGIFCINSDGGLSWSAELLTEALNQKPGIEIRALSAVGSAALNLFLKCKNRKSLSGAFILGMAHLSTVNTDYRTLLIDKANEEVQAITRSFETLHKKEVKFAQTYMTKEELKAFKEGKNVFFDYNRMQEIINQFNDTL